MKLSNVKIRNYHIISCCTVCRSWPHTPWKPDSRIDWYWFLMTLHFAANFFFVKLSTHLGRAQRNAVIQWLRAWTSRSFPSSFIQCGIHAGIHMIIMRPSGWLSFRPSTSPPSRWNHQYRAYWNFSKKLFLLNVDFLGAGGIPKLESANIFKASLIRALLMSHHQVRHHSYWLDHYK